MDEGSIISMSKANNISSNEKTSGGDEVSLEESGWTMYFEDFFNHDQNNDHHRHQQYPYYSELNGSDATLSSGIESSSFISDAASTMFPNNKKVAAGDVKKWFHLDKNGDRIIPRKRKNKKVFAVDDDLEDTASSPVSSPKMYDMMKNLESGPKHREFMEIYQEKGSTSGEARTDLERNTSGLVSSIGEDNDISELKKRGLCLVPLSTIINYVG